MRILLCILLLCVGLMSGEPAMARAFTDDLGRHVTVPDHPLRIVSLYDVDITIPLIELGHPPIGSHGRIGRDGKPTLRASKQLTGVDFDNSNITFLGAAGIDLETLMRLKPDLILTEVSRPTPVEKLAQIAPVVALDSSRGAPHVYAALARLVNAEPRLAQLKARYAAELAQLRARTHPENRTVSVLMPLHGRLSIYHSYRALGQVLRDAGFHFAPLLDEIQPGGRLNVSPERLPDLDADIIFQPYNTSGHNSAQRALARMQTLMPGYCAVLRACRQGHYVLVNRDEAISNSYAALSRMVAVVQGAISTRDLASGGAMGHEPASASRTTR